MSAQTKSGSTKSGLTEERSYGKYTAKWSYPVEKTDSDDEDDQKDDQKDDQEEFVLSVEFYKDNELLYTLKRNGYRTYHHKYLLLEYFEIGDQVVHLFNLEHSVISIVNADTGVEIHRDKLYDMFIEDYQMFDNREYMYISGWVWQPFAVRAIYHIPTFLTTPKYKPTYISCWDGSSRTGHISIYGCATVKEFLEKKDEIKNKYDLEVSTNLFNENRTKETLLRILLNSNECVVKFKDAETKEKLEQLLNTDQSEFKIEAHGMISKKYLPQYNNVLYCIAEYDDADNSSLYRKPHRSDSLSRVCAKVLFQTTVSLPITDSHLRFEIYATSGRFTIYYKQEFVWDGKESLSHDWHKKRYMLDDSKPCEIFIE